MLGYTTDAGCFVFLQHYSTFSKQASILLLFDSKRNCLTEFELKLILCVSYRLPFLVIVLLFNEPDVIDISLIDPFHL